MTASAPPGPVDKLEDRIRAFMAEGLALADDVQRFMETTFGSADAQTLRHVLADADGSERESLLDLIFFPDPELQVAIEPLLADHPFDTADIPGLAGRLKREPVAARLRIPGEARAVPLAMPAFAVDAFLSRLNLPWQPVEALAAIMAQWDARLLSPGGDAEGGRLRLRVRLRNAGLRQTAPQVRFVGNFLKRMPAATASFVDDLDFVLVFLQEHQEARNLYQVLMDRKRFIFRHLLQARRAGEFAARNNMETLVMTGVRRPYFDTAAAEQTLVVIDRVATAVFGRTEWLSEALGRVDMGHYPDGLDPAKLIRRLS